MKIYLSVLNIIACIAAIALHCNGIVHQYSESIAWKTSLIVEVLCYWSVPVFLLIAGANLLGNHKKYELKDFIYRHIKRLLSPYVLISMIVIIYKIGAGNLPLSDRSVRGIIEFFMYHNYEPIYYYVFIIIGIYLTIPLLTPLTDSENEKLLNYGILMLFFNNIVMTSLVQSYNLPFNSSLSLNIGNYMIYILLGYKLANVVIGSRKRIILYVVSLLLIFYKYFFTLEISMRNQAYDQTLAGYTHVITVITAVAIFEFVKNIDFSIVEKNIRLKVIINKLARYSYLVYLLHMLIIDIQIRLFNININSIAWRTLGIFSTYITTIVFIVIIEYIFNQSIKRIKFVIRGENSMKISWNKICNRRKLVCSVLIIFIAMGVMLGIYNLVGMNTSEVSVKVNSTMLQNELNTDHESTLYTGELVVTNHHDIPSDGNQYLILDVMIEVGDLDQTFKVSNLLISDGKNKYKVLNSAFLKNHYYNPITTKEISMGVTMGNIVYEVPNDINMNELKLTYSNHEINLSDLEVKSNSIIKNTNIQIDENEVDYNTQQKVIDKNINVALETGAYTFENPYIVQDPYGRSPLTALVCFKTQEEMEITISIESKSEYGDVNYTVPGSNTTHLIPITGMYADYNNKITMSSNIDDTIQVLNIQTGELPEGTTSLEVDVLELNKDDEHFTRVAFQSGFPTVIDVTGEIRWLYNETTHFAYDYMENGHIMLHKNVLQGTTNEGVNCTARFLEVDMLGKVYNVYEIEDNMHHDFMYLGDNRIAWTSYQETGIGMEDAIMIMDLTDGTVLEHIDLNLILDRYRPSLTYVNFEDWFHVNSIDSNDNDDMIISGRQQGIIKIDKNRELEWIIASHNDWEKEYQEYLLTPVDENNRPIYDMSNEEEFWEANLDFFPWHNHGIEFCEDLDGNPNTEEIAVFDNRNFRDKEYAEYNNYSQGIVYSIDVENKTIKILRKFGKDLGKDFHSTTVSDTNILNNSNMLITSGDTVTEPEINAYMVEVTEENQIMWSLKFSDKIWEADEVEIYLDNFQPEITTDVGIYKYSTLKVESTIPNVEKYKIKDIDSSPVNISHMDNDTVLLLGEFEEFEFDRQYGYMTAVKSDGTEDVYGFLVQTGDNNDDTIYVNDLIHLKEEYVSYYISVKDERAKIIYQYPRYNFPEQIEPTYFDKDIVLKDQENSISNIDKASINKGNNLFTLNGWSIIKGIDSKDSSKINMIFNGEKNSYVIPLTMGIRTDVTSHFNDNYNYDNSGFNGKVNLELLPTDRYTITIEILNGENIGYTHTDYFIEIDHNDAVEPILNNDYIAHQNIMTEGIFKEYGDGEYTLKEPYVKVDPYGIAPLSAIALFNTKEPAKISIHVDGLNGGDDISNSYSEFVTSHQIPIYGLYAEKETKVTIKAEYKDGKSDSVVLKLSGNKLPKDFVQMTVNKSEPELMANGLTFYMRQARTTYFNALDSKGDVRFMYSAKSIGMASGLTMLKNGNIVLVSEKSSGTQYYKESMYEMDFTGKIYGEYQLEGVHHEITEANNGNFLALGNDITDTVIEDVVYEIDRTTGEIIKYWDLDDILPLEAYDESGNRVSTEVYEYNSHDWIHLNSVDQHPHTDEILLSGRNHDIVISIDYKTGEINYIIGDHDLPLPNNLKDKLLDPIGNEFEWSYGQHNAQFLENGDIILFDNGSYRKNTKNGDEYIEENSYSRGVIYRVDQEKMTVEEVWEYGKELGSSHLATYLSGVQYLGENHILINFGGQVFDKDGAPSYVNNDAVEGHSASIQYEVKDGEIIYSSSFEIDGVSGNMYRAERHDLYQSKIQPDISILAKRLGTLQSRDQVIEFDLDLDNSLEILTKSVSDNGMQIEYQFGVESSDEDEMYMIFKAEDKSYKILLGQGESASGSINHVEIPTGDYKLYLQSGDKMSALGLSWKNTTIAGLPYSDAQRVASINEK